MKRNAIAVLFFLVSLMAASCTKMDALFNNGEPVTEQRSVDHRFSAISMYNNVNVKLVQDSNPRLELTCPKNLIEKVTTEVHGDSLIIKNENDHNWLRSYDYDIDLTVYFDSLNSIRYASIGNLLCSDSIGGFVEQSIDSTENGIDTVWTHVFNLYIVEGSGDIDLTFQCDVLRTHFNNGTSEVTLRGITSYSEIDMRSYGNVHAETLESNFVRVQSYSTNDAYVWARSGLRVWIYSIGDVYYKGHPWIVDAIHGDGRIIKLE
ncbi:MAG: DUF2807 domain-containing protein [Bacteroidales bacterium]|nr:DUF2807 domain-containing protein [Bacteroidales bacterium]